MHGKNIEEYVGALHVHSTYSDGTGAVSEILDAARRADADFVLLSDHDTLAARREGWEGWHDGVLLIVGTEITPRRQGHCLAVGVRECLGYSLMDTREYLARVRDQGGAAIVAHPLGEHKREFRIHQMPWQHWGHPAVVGLEIWSYMHDWIADLQFWRPHEYYDFCKRPHTKITGPDPRVLQIWDRVGRGRRLAGVSGLDCHARRVPLTDMKLFPYEQMFRTVRTHLVCSRLGGDARDADALVRALRNGAGFVAYDLLRDSRGTRAWAECDSGTVLSLGAERAAPGRAEGRVRFCIRLPAAGAIRLCRDGVPIASTNASEMSHRARGPGVYRFEVSLHGKPWIFTNPFYVRARR